MDETETIPYASLKRKMTLMIVKHLSMLSQKEKMKMNLMKKYIKNRSLKLLLRLKNKLLRTKKNLSKVNLNPTRLIFKFQKNQILKKYRIFLTRSKKKNQQMLTISSLMTMIFFTVKRFLMQLRNLLLMLLTEQMLLPLLKDSSKNQIRQKWKLFILRKKN